MGNKCYLNVFSLKMIFITLLSGLICLNSIIYCVRHDVHEMMYKKFDGAPACFRRLNGTHQFGCSSPRGGSYGVVHFIRNESDLIDFLQNAVAGPYAVILTPVLFRNDVLHSLIDSNKVSGIILNTALTPEVDPIPATFSPDDECPNRYSGVDKTCPVMWNPAANRFLLNDWPLPIFLVKNTDHYVAISECHDKFNPPLDETQLNRPLCSLHLKSHMFAAVDSETCLRRINFYGVNAAKYCDPLGDENVVLPSLSWTENGNRNVILVGARLDTFSIFDGIAPGAMSTVTGLVTFITTANIFHRMLSMEAKQPANNVSVIFILFNGETEDYIGSSRVVYDMQQGLFPSRNQKLSLNNVRLFIEFSHLSSNNEVFIHHTSDEIVADFMSQLNGTVQDIVFESSHVENLPPASFQSFYKVDKGISGAILSNFDKVFLNKYYNSMFDTAKYLGYVYANGSFIDKSPIYALQKRLAGIAQTVATYLYRKTMNKEPPQLDHQHSIILTDELLHCYIETRKCRLMKEVAAVASDKLPDLLPLYVGVKNNPENFVARVTGFMLAYLTGKNTTLDRENCVNDENQKGYAYMWMNGESGNGICINSTVQFTPAESPAFLIEGYNWKSGEYATWTESVWDASSLGLFIKPYRLQEIIILCTGLSVLLLSFIVVFWFNKKAEFLFMPISPTSC